VFAGGLKNGIERLSNLLGSTFPSDFLNLRFDSVFRKATQLSWLEDVSKDWHSPAKPPTFLRTETTHMDWNRVEGNWKQVKGKVKEKWGKLTDDDLTTINGRRDQLEGKIQERYGYAKDQAQKEVDNWYNSQNW
jgi:uncharacterized protein YjbJ (UPF0337 family)